MEDLAQRHVTGEDRSPSGDPDSEEATGLEDELYEPSSTDCDSSPILSGEARSPDGDIIYTDLPSSSDLPKGGRVACGKNKRPTSTQPSPGGFSDVSRHDKYQRIRNVKEHNPRVRRGSLGNVTDKRTVDRARRPTELNNSVRTAPKPTARADVGVEDNAQVTPAAMTYRSNLVSVVTALQKLPFTTQHMNAIKRTPFWLFIKASLNIIDPVDMMRLKKRDSNIASVVKRYKIVDGEKGFLFGDVFLTPDTEDFKLIFGIRDGCVPVATGSGPVMITPFLKRCFPEKAGLCGEKAKAATGRLSAAICQRVLVCKVAQGDNVDAQDVASLVHLYLLSSFFMPTQNLSVNWRLTETVADYQKLSDYDWSSFLLNQLIVDLGNSNNYRIGSCALFLLYWICEHTNIISPVNGSGRFPRFMKWDLEEFAKRLSKSNIDSIARKLEIKWALSRTNEECKLLMREQVEVTRRRPGQVSFRSGDVNERQRNKQGSVMCIRSKPVSVIKNAVDGKKKATIPGSKARHDVVDDISVQPELHASPSRAAKGKGLLHPSEETDEFIGSEIQFCTNTADDLCKLSLHSAEGNHGSAQRTGDLGVHNNDDNWVDSLFSDGPDGSMNRTPLAPASVNGDESSAAGACSKTISQKTLADMELRVKELAAELGVLRNNNMRLKNDLEVKDKLKEAEWDKSNIAFKEAARDTIDVLRADNVESRQVQDRLGRQCMASQRRIRLLEQESYQFKDKLTLEIAKTVKLTAENATLALSEKENKERKIQLVIENDRLKVEIGLLTKQLDDALSIPPSSLGVVNVGMSNPAGVLGVCSQTATPDKPPAGSLAALRAASLDKGGSSPGKSANTPGTCTQSGSQTPHEFGDLAGVKLFNSPVVPRYSGSADPNILGAGVIVRSSSPDSERSRSLRAQEDIVIRSRKHKVLDYPISVTYGNTPMKVVPDNASRPMSVDRSCFAYQKTLPYFINFLINKFKLNLPSASFLKVQNTYMNNSISLLNIEQLMNHDRVEDCIIDTWGLLINKEHGEMSRPMQTRRLVSSRTYLFRSFCWINVARYDVDNWHKTMCKHFIDMKILEALNYPNWLFPICTTGGLDPITNEPNQWGLLRYGPKQGTWLFYNPLQPVKVEDDEHFTAAKLLANYVEKQIKQSGCSHRIPVLRADHIMRMENYKDAQQQGGDSLDSGVVVCSMIELLIDTGMVLKKNWTAEYGGEVRAKMINKFCETVQNLEK